MIQGLIFKGWFWFFNPLWVCPNSQINVGRVDFIYVPMLEIQFCPIGWDLNRWEPQKTLAGWNACPLPALPRRCPMPCLPCPGSQAACLPACPAWNLESGIWNAMPAIIHQAVMSCLCYCFCCSSGAPVLLKQFAIWRLTVGFWILLLLYSNVLQARSKRKFYFSQVIIWESVFKFI